LRAFVTYLNLSCFVILIILSENYASCSTLLSLPLLDAKLITMRSGKHFSDTAQQFLFYLAERTSTFNLQMH
jgi:hypothetical protein